MWRFDKMIFVLFLDKKNQKSSNQIGFFCRTGLCTCPRFAFTLQNQAIPIAIGTGLGLYHGRAAHSLRAMKIPLALQPHFPASFCLIFV
jgi:hypothetical protein